MKMNLQHPIILASKSPRRQELLKEINIEFSVRTKDTEESYPDDMPASQVAIYLAEKKAEAFRDEISDEIIIASDTVVILEDKILGKPSGYQEAKHMLQALSGKKHDVITGVCLLSKSLKMSFQDVSSVYFKKLSEQEIDYYIDNYKPMDKAGAYGIQEWIGMIGVEKIEGSYYNVVGLPIQKLYQYLIKFDNLIS